MRDYVEKSETLRESGVWLEKQSRLRKINPPTGRELAENIRYSIKTSLNHSLVLAGMFALLFAIARVIGFAFSTDVHYLNYLFSFFVAYDSLNKSYRHKKEFLSYFSGIMVGMVTIMLAHLWFAIVFFFYLLLDPAFTAFLMERFTYIQFAPRVSISAMIFSEGAGLSVILSLVLIQFFMWRKHMDPYFDNKR
jgi:hypothetical protein